MKTIQHVLSELERELVGVRVVLESPRVLSVFGTDRPDVVGRVLDRLLVETKKREWIDNHFKMEIDYNSCLECGDILGSCNPRQLCRKFYCPNAQKK
jgi:hypothetical protein